LKKNTMLICLSLGAALALTSAAGAAKNTAGARRDAGGGAFASPAQDAKNYTHKESGITFDVPAGWKAEPDGEQLTVSSPDDSVALVFWVPTESTFDAAVEALDEELAKTIKNMKADGEVKVDTHNGMRHAGQSGTGEIEGKNILWSVDMLQAKKPVIILTFAAPEQIEKHAGDYAKIVKSIRKAD
jgi:predicted Zn-dependent protease